MAPPAFVEVLSFLVHLLVFFANTNASPLLQHRVEDLQVKSTELQRRQSSFVPVTGIQGFGIRPRLEIRQLQQNTDQWNLYMLGLARFQATDQSDKLSWYQIAGIHGRPYSPWDGVGPASGQNSPGFCVHVSNVFLTWHRPFLALFEQALFSHIIEAVNEFPEGSVRQRYAEAALGWRAPYWDWATPPPAGQSVYPTSIYSPNVTVTMPNGTNTIPNPLLRYRFHPVSQADFYYAPFAQWNQTMRYPTNWTQEAVSQDELIGPVLDNNRQSFQDRLYNLFVNYNNFSEFGNEAWMGPGVSNADSLESIHDAIHSITGSNGHMTYLDYSAFDPIFFLHHAMVDRLFALWQVLYNGSYVEPMTAVEQTYNIAVGQVEDVNSPLEPFHSNANGNFWTSASARSPATFGYTYSDLYNGNVSSVKAAINKLYGVGVPGASPLSRRSTRQHLRTEHGIHNSLSDPEHAPEEVTNGQYREYLANILTQKFALNGSYAVYVFLGKFDNDPASWPTANNLVGTHAVFAALSGSDSASNPQARRRQADAPILVTATMPLTNMLLAKAQSGELPCMDPEMVESYLATNLQWRVAMFNGTEMPIPDVAGLEVTVVTAQVRPATGSDQFPVWGNYTILPNATPSRVNVE